MDIFSGVKNINSQNYDNLASLSKRNKNINASKTLVQRNNEFQKEQMDKKSIKEIKKELQKITEELNKAMNPLNDEIKFHFNNKIDELTVKVIDKKNNEVIREFPPKEALKLMEKMRELVGMLFDKKG